VAPREPADLKSLQARLQESDERLAVAEAMLHAIRGGEVDAFVVDREGKPAIYMLKSAGEPYRVLIEQMGEGALTVSQEGIILYCNSSIARMLGEPREQVIGTSLRERIHGEAADHWRAASGEASREVELRTASGLLPVLMSSQPVHLDDGPAHCIVIADLSRQKHRALHEAVVESALDAVFALDQEGLIRTWPAAAEQLFGYAPPEALGKSIRMLMPKDGLEREWSKVMSVLNGASLRLEAESITKSGKRIDTRVSLAPIREYGGQITGVAITARDVTEQKSNERHLRTLNEELVHVARITEMGQLSAGIAHELNQPLAAMMNYAGLAKRLIINKDVAATEKAGDAISRACEQALRAAEIIRHMREFVEKRPTKRTSESVNNIVAESITLALLGEKGSHLKCESNLAPELPWVLVDRVQIQQVLVNLLRNAIEAMQDVRKRELTVTTAMVEGGLIEVRVADTGTGIPESVAKRLFQPFVTSKPTGMGIGLPISKSIIEAHGGSLRTEPRSGGGTIFRFTIPVVATRPR